MASVLSNVAAEPSAGNSAPLIPSPAPPSCHHCGKPPIQARRKRRPSECGPVQLKLSYNAATRQQLRRLLYTSRLPQSEFATYVLGVDEATVYRYLQGGTIPQSKATHLRNIEYIQRDEAVVHIVVRTCAERTRWNMMTRKRARNYPMATEE